MARRVARAAAGRSRTRAATRRSIRRSSGRSSSRRRGHRRGTAAVAPGRRRPPSRAAARRRRPARRTPRGSEPSSRKARAGRQPAVAGTRAPTATGRTGTGSSSSGPRRVAAADGERSPSRVPPAPVSAARPGMRGWVSSERDVGARAPARRCARGAPRRRSPAAAAVAPQIECADVRTSPRRRRSRRPSSARGRRRSAPRPPTTARLQPVWAPADRAPSAIARRMPQHGPHSRRSRRDGARSDANRDAHAI